MAKALIAIGVGSTEGGFPKLKGARKDAKAFYEWGIAQGFECKLFVDERRKKIRAADIFDAINGFVSKRGAYSQIVVYFSGHGVLKAPDCELWVLSGAPTNPNEVINVCGSITNARASGIEHVVFISDACRSLPSDMKGASIGIGQNIFSFVEYVTPAPEVDVFYATLPGDVALELPPDETTQRDRGLLTQCLLEALEGKVPDLIRPQAEDDGVLSHVVHCRPLKAWLTSAVPLAAAAVSFKLRQMPDTRLESDPQRYLSKLKPPPKLQLRPSSAANIYGETDTLPLGVYDQTSPPRRLVPARNTSRLRSTSPRLPAQGRERKIPARLFKEPTSLPNAGIVVRGGALAFATGPSGSLEVAVKGNEAWVVPGPDMDLSLSGQDGCPIALRFADGSGTVVAALPGYTATVIVEAGAITAVNYTPTPGSPDFEAYREQADDLCTYRALVAQKARSGRSSLENPPLSASITDKQDLLHALDPALGIHACYNYARAGAFGKAVELHRTITDSAKPVPFDIAMLAGQVSPVDYPAARPGMPMLTQGWMMLGRFEQLLPHELQEVRQFLMPSLWSTFSSRGMAILESYIQKGN